MKVIHNVTLCHETAKRYPQLNCTRLAEHMTTLPILAG